MHPKFYEKLYIDPGHQRYLDSQNQMLKLIDAIDELEDPELSLLARYVERVRKFPEIWFNYFTFLLKFDKDPEGQLREIESNILIEQSIMPDRPSDNVLCLKVKIFNEPDPKRSRILHHKATREHVEYLQASFNQLPALVLPITTYLVGLLPKQTSPYDIRVVDHRLLMNDFYTKQYRYRFWINMAFMAELNQHITLRWADPE